MLGGSHFQIPAIKYAREAGYYVITADYLPNNPGHKFSNEYYNVSTIDLDSVLKLSEKLKIDGILSYASDPGAPTAAYVAEKLGLPGNPYESVKILQRKDLFRKFLKENGFNSPQFESFTDVEKAKEFARERITHNPLILKPADSSGSKGVTKIESLSNFENYFNNALQYSINKLIIIEDFIVKDGYQMDGDGFAWNGNLAFRCFGTQHNDLACNKYVPVGISFPCIHDDYIQNKAHNIVSSILKKLNMVVGGLNIEYIVTDKGDVYILEIGPRSGGNLIPEVIKKMTGIDLIALSVDGALGKNCSNIKMVTTVNSYFSSYIIHSQKEGTLIDIKIDERLKAKIVQIESWVVSGERVKMFNGSDNTIGTMILKFANNLEMVEMLDNMDKYIEVVVN